MPLEMTHNLQALLGLTDLDGFLDGSWETAPVVARATIRGREEHLLTLDQLEALMGGALSGSTAGLSIVQDHRARPIAPSAAPAERLELALEAYRGGHALLLTGLQRLWSPIARLCRRIEDSLVARGLALTEAVGANAYLGPRRSQGFGIHYDNHCVVVLQLHGQKSWEVFAPAVALPVARCEQTIPREQLGSPILATTLEAGDVLYVPRGFPHVATCAESSSMHLSLSLRTLTWAELIAAMGARLPALRRSVPAHRGNEAGVKRLFAGEILSGLASLDPVEAAKRRGGESLVNLGPLPGGRVRAIDEAEHTGEDTPLTTPEPAETQAPHAPGALTFRRGDGPNEGAHLGWLHSVERLSAETCRELIEACRQFPLIPPSTVGEDRYPGHRKADARKIGVNPGTRWVFDFLGRIAAEVSRTVTFLELTEISRAPQYVEYRPGWGRFDWHNDYSHGQPVAPRKLTIILQLSAPDEYEGGDLEVFGTEVTALPREQGAVLVLPSIVPHRVTPVTAGLRRALVAWIAGPRLR